MVKSGTGQCKYLHDEKGRKFVVGTIKKYRILNYA